MSSPVVTFRSGEAKICDALRYEEGNEILDFSIDPHTKVLALPTGEDWRKHFPPVVRDKKEAVVALLVQACRKVKWIVLRDDVGLDQTLPVVHVRRGSPKVSYCGNLARVGELDVEERKVHSEAGRPII